MKVVEMKIGDLIPYENNPRRNDGAVDAVAASIKEFGFKVPIVIDSDSVIVAGHTRLKAAKKLGLKTVPVVVADDLSPEQVKAFRLADNKTAEFSVWDVDALAKEPGDINDIDMSEFGFSLEAIQIENIDQDILEAEEPIARELNEANNYVVLEFFTETEWEEAQTVFGLKRCCTGDENKNIRRYGIGRVINGAEVLSRLMHEN